MHCGRLEKEMAFMNQQMGQVVDEFARNSPQVWAQACGHVRTEAAVVLIALLGTGAVLAFITILCVRALRKEHDVHGFVIFGVFAPFFWCAWFTAIAVGGSENLATALYPQQKAARYLPTFTEDQR